MVTTWPGISEVEAPLPFRGNLAEQNAKRDGTIGEKWQSIGTDERMGQVADLLPGRGKNSELRIQKS
jgi:hypothetical protein